MNDTRKTVAERLAAGLEHRPNGCLEWTRSTQKFGYGQINIDGRPIVVHRVAWTLANGPIPPGMNVLHHCDNPPCAETEPSEAYPEGHLFLGTKADNTKDMMAKGRGRYEPHRGEDHGCAVLTLVQVQQIRERRAEGQTLASIGLQFGVTKQQIWRITKGLSWATRPSTEGVQS